MAVPGIPTNFYAQQASRVVYLSWDIAAGATSYTIQRSTDGVNFSTIATVAPTNYTDSTVTTGTLYYYQVASVNGSGTGIYTNAQSVVPAPTGEMSLGQIRLAAQQRADKVNSNFVTLPEWNSYINQSMYELYDLLVTTYNDYYVATPAIFSTDGVNYLFPLPNGQTSFTNGISLASGYIAPSFYKLMRVDLGVNTSQNAWVTLRKFNFLEGNNFLYPNTNSAVYGAWNMQYRPLGNNLELTPLPSANQQIRLWYVPRLTEMVQDTDITSTSISGWIEYVIVDAAIKALQKQEADITVLMAQKMALIKRIEDSAANRDQSRPDTITDTRATDGWNSSFGGNGFRGGY